MLSFLKPLPLQIALALFWTRAFANSFAIHKLLYNKQYAEANDQLRKVWLLDPKDREHYEVVLDRMWRQE